MNDKTEDRGSGGASRPFFGSPVVTIIACQMIAGAIVFAGIGQLLQNITGTVPPFMALLVLQGVLAAVGGLFAGLSKWWIPVQAVLPAAAATSLRLQVPAYVWLILFVLVALVYWNSARGGVPLYLSNRRTWTELKAIVAGRKGMRFVDLGAGLGGTTLHLARSMPEASFVAIESAPIPFALAWIRAKMAGLKNLEVHYGDFWNAGLGEFDVAYAFLSPLPMAKLYEKVRSEMPAGGLFISNSFTVPDVEADEIRTLDDRRRTRLHIWRL